MNIGDPDQTPHSMASDLGLQCLSMSHKKASCPTKGCDCPI